MLTPEAEIYVRSFMSFLTRQSILYRFLVFAENYDQLFGVKFGGVCNQFDHSWLVSGSNPLRERGGGLAERSRLRPQLTGPKDAQMSPRSVVSRLGRAHSGRASFGIRPTEARV